MNNLTLSNRYNPKDVETKWYTLWESKGYFKPASDQKRDIPQSEIRIPNYVIVIPPPNVTGILHMGHALNNTIQDVLTRWNRMKGRDTLWIPGVDHAGIATQNVVEKKLAKEKITRQQLGREKFLEQVWNWKNEYGGTITKQLRRLGASCDWSRERFTMDEGLSKAVREAFVTLYERGLIYQGDYIINWCPRCQTALSDEEAEHKEVEGGFYHIKYPIKGGNLEKDFIVVATTRPETMLGDTGVAVHPEDPRYQHLHGKKLLLPLMNREIPIITDTFVDREFGTGMVKVTPAHDPNDFAMGNRHNLERINVLTPDGHINENGGVYKGLERFAARKKIIEDLETLGLFIKKEKHKHAVGHCYRCHTVVEPYLSKQWFVKMQPLAEKALKAHREGKTKFYPDRWTKVYTNWLEGIRDWCISRQIWWGHQVPVWYCMKCKSIDYSPQSIGNNQNKNTMDYGPLTMDSPKGVIVSRETPSKCPTCGGTDLKQDPDVLDTWFSSWLWPFSTLGWPEKTNDLAHFYPTSDLVTASEIIFFWVARMIMAGLEFRGEVPFSRILIHGTVRAEGGLKMSKSLGNSIDPLEVIDEMGADALRFSMIMLSAQDVYLSREKFEVGRNFTNKLWNASRFVMIKLQTTVPSPQSIDYSLSTKNCRLLPNRWILSRLNHVAETVGKHLSQFALAQAATELYHFVWNDYCDWFIELSKPVLDHGTAKEQAETRAVLFEVLENILRLLHPWMPFITEELWQHLKSISSESSAWPESIMLAPWPAKSGTGPAAGTIPFSDSEAEKEIEWLQSAVSGIRDLRVRVNLPPSQTVQAVVVTSHSKASEVFRIFTPQMKILGRLEELKAEPHFKKSRAYIGNAFKDFEIYIRIEGLVNYEEECKRIQKKIAELEGWIAGISKKLSNENFVRNAPSEVVEQEKAKLLDAQKVAKAQQELLAVFQS